MSSLNCTLSRFFTRRYSSCSRSYLQRFQDELDQIEIKNHIGQRQKTPQHASRKALIESTIGAERHEYETSGIGKYTKSIVSRTLSICSLEVPNLCQTDVVRELR